MHLGLTGKAIYTELCSVYGSSEVTYRTVLRWISKFKTGKSTLKDDAGRGRKPSAINEKTIKKVKDLIEQDARFTLSTIARLVGISKGSAYTILKKKLGVSKIAARWIPHLLSPEQKEKRVSCAKKLLKMFPKYSSRKFSNIVTGDESWFHFFEPTRKINNKIWATKQGRRPTIAKRLISAKKVMYAIFFGIHGIVTQLPVPKKRSVNAKFYKKKVLTKVEKYYRKLRPKTGMKGLFLLHDNATPHKSAIVKDFLEKRACDCARPPSLLARPCTL